MTAALASNLRRARSRPSAFADFYAAHSRGLLVFFVRRTFDVEVARDLTAERVAAAFDELAPDQRDALRLRVIDERSYPDLAVALGVSEQTARARVARALRRIADAVETTGHSEVTP
jgi:RNA polymerase sigma factor (sigma-70 family)